MLLDNFACDKCRFLENKLASACPEPTTEYVVFVLDYYLLCC